jgi:hypothetical protein
LLPIKQTWVHYPNHNRAVKNPGINLQVENIDIALNWEQGVFKQILSLTLFKTIEKRNTYEKKRKHNYSEKNFTNIMTQESCNCNIVLIDYGSVS